MGTISLQIPQSGQPNSSEDPKVASDLTLLQTLLNGNVDTNNLSASAGIVSSQLATTARRLNITSKTTNYNAAAGELVVGGAGITVNLPTPVGNKDMQIGVAANSGVTGSSPITVASGSGNAMYGVGFSNAGNITLGTPGAVVVFQSDGSSWFCVAGGQDSGWAALSLASGFTNPGGSYGPSARILGDRVWFSGLIHNNTGGTVAGGTTLATLPPGCAPASTVYMVVAASSTVNELTVPASTLTLQNVPAITLAQTVVLDGVSYRLV